MFIGKTDVEAETPILWPPHAKSWLIGEDPGSRKDWGQEEKGMTEDEMVGWHHQLDGHGFRWTLGVGDGQGGLACCRSWGHKESDMTERLNWTELNWCRTNQDGWVMVESSDKMWSTGEGNGKTLQYSCLEKSVNSMKSQKDMTMKDELPGSLGAQYATG